MHMSWNIHLIVHGTNNKQLHLTSANLKYKCDIPCVILIFLTERLVSVNVKIVCKYAAIVWNIEAIFCNPVVGSVVVQWTKAFKQGSFFETNHILSHRNIASVFSQLEQQFQSKSQCDKWKKMSYMYIIYNTVYWVKLCIYCMPCHETVCVPIFYEVFSKQSYLVTS